MFYILSYASSNSHFN
jgi:hypothetical protein